MDRASLCVHNSLSFCLSLKQLRVFVRFPNLILYGKSRTSAFLVFLYGLFASILANWDCLVLPQEGSNNLTYSMVLLKLILLSSLNWDKLVLIKAVECSIQQLTVRLYLRNNILPHSDAWTPSAQRWQLVPEAQERRTPTWRTRPGSVGRQSWRKPPVRLQCDTRSPRRTVGPPHRGCPRRRRRTRAAHRGRTQRPWQAPEINCRAAIRPGSEPLQRAGPSLGVRTCGSLSKCSPPAAVSDSYSCSLPAGY